MDSKEKAEAVKAEIIAARGAAETSQCNVSDFDACGAFIKETVKKYGQIDILVNNAGITKDGLLMAMSEDDFCRVIDTNLKGTFNWHSSCGQTNVEAEKRTHCKYGIHCWHRRKPRTG